MNSKRVSLTDLQPGDIVAKDMLDEQGNLILSEETVLTEKVIAGLVKRDVTEVCVLEQLVSDTGDVDIDKQAAIQNIFRNQLDKPLMMGLKNIVLDYVGRSD